MLGEHVLVVVAFRAISFGDISTVELFYLPIREHGPHAKSAATRTLLYMHAAPTRADMCLMRVWQRRPNFGPPSPLCIKNLYVPGI